MLKAVILIGGPQKGTRFRPLSLDTPKPLFPVAGLPLIQHHIEACVQLEECKEILIIGSYTVNLMQQFVSDMMKEYHVTIRYLQEFTPLGTAGGLYHFRDQIRAGDPAAFFLLNGDVCADFPLKELWKFHEEKGPNAVVTIMGTEATRQQSVHYGCMALSPDAAVTHYVEKPSTYVATLINCGAYVCAPTCFHIMAELFQKKQKSYYTGNGVHTPEYMSWEQDVLAPLAGTNKLFAMQVTNWWSQLKTAGSAIYANRHYLQLYRRRAPARLSLGPHLLPDVYIHPTATVDDSAVLKTAGSAIYANRHYLQLYRRRAPARLSLGPHLLPDVYIHPTATVDDSAVIGPNVSIGAGVQVQAGVRIKESIILNNATIHEHALVMYSVVGQDATVGPWARVEGTPSDPDPDKPFAKMDNTPLFNADGRLNPSITILGAGVSVPAETILLNSIVLPHKQLTRSFKHEIIL